MKKQNKKHRTILATKDLLEKLAELEHKQWVYWSRSLASTEKLSIERLERWKELWRPYNELPEEMKEMDRKWARRILKEIMKIMKKKSTPQIKKYSKKVDEVLKIKDKVESGQKIIGEVDTLNKIISETIYIRDNIVVDFQNFSLISITPKSELT